MTGANSVALGANATWGGILITNPGGPVTMNAGNALTLGPAGVGMSGATQGLTIGSGLTPGWGTQRWNVTNGVSLTVNGTVTRSAGAALVVGSQTVAPASLGTVTALLLMRVFPNGFLPGRPVAKAPGTLPQRSNSPDPY